MPDVDRRRLARTITVGDVRARGERRRLGPPQVAIAAGGCAWWPSGGMVIHGDAMHGEIGGDV